MGKGTLNDKYIPKDFEEKLYKKWEENGYFKAKVDKSKEPFTIVMPPPNITGKLHMGHALDNTLQDILIRFKRMMGYNALWVPGTDHAAIATEAKIVEALKKEGIKKEDLTREQFLEKAWEWKKEYGGTIVKQLRKIGCSCDWDRERFTMDEGLSEAVLKVFVDLYNKGLIYKGKRMTNWCPCCKTAISDAEVEFEEEASHLWHIRYSSKDGKYSVVVATTRPETMLGDTAVAVHPDDERYKDLIGKTVVLPLVNKEIPIVADDFVEKEFGTGAVKITPAHDPNDYATALRHNLEIINVFDDEAKMLDIVPKYKGMDTLTAREEIVKDLEKEGVLVKIEDYAHNVGKCYRCHSTIEPKPSEQWFVKMEPLAKPAIEAVKEGKTKFVPERFAKTYYNWMENIQDWCISRQIWWGHIIPAYSCNECGETMVLATAPEKCTKCGSTNLRQDEDTLDTWFSSALWPFSTLGYPKETEDLKYFYPTSTLVTGYDIIFFWVARMIFSAIEHTGEVPFNTVFIHGIVRDSLGRKMSKSLGNGIDPLEVIDQYGTDALRFSLVLNTSPGNDLRYMPEKIEAAGNFANKIWNASKFVLMNLTRDEEIFNYDINKLKIEDKWILSKLNKTIREVTENINNYDLGVALQKIYDFIWDEFCDWYIEMVKPRLYDAGNPTRLEAEFTLNYVLTCALKLLHPFMPFVTEEIYTKLIGAEKTIMLTDWPKAEEKFDFNTQEEQVEVLKQIITSIRNARANMNIHPAKKSQIIFVTETFDNAIKDGDAFIKKLGFGEEIIVTKVKENIPENALSVTAPGVEAYIPLAELIDKEAELARLNKEKEKATAEFDKLSTMLNNQGFVTKAPETKVNEIRNRCEELKAILGNIEKSMEDLK